MNERERHFLRVVDDLSERIGSDDPYVVLGGSALMRQLFLDPHPLIDQVNEKHRLRLQFHVGVPSFPIDEHTTVLALLDGIDPDTGRPGRPTAQMTRDQLLAATVLVSNGRPFTIRDIILFEANIMGGVHAGSPKSEKEKALETVSQFLHYKNHRATLGELKAIGRVMLKGLAPLRVAMEEHDA